MTRIVQKISRMAGEYLTYNRSEQRGIFVLMLLLMGLILLYAFIPDDPLPFAKEDPEKFDAEVRAFLTAWKAAADSDSLARIDKYRPEGSSMNFAGAQGPESSGWKKNLVMVELNAADSFDLQQLKGIGPGFARRIIGYRERLQGYFNKEQLLEVYGMDSSRYRAIAGQVTVNRDSIRPMNLNTVTFKEMIRHPYFPFHVTKSIMLYRQKYKAFKTLEELRKVEVINDSLYRRLVVYLRIVP